MDVNQKYAFYINIPQRTNIAMQYSNDYTGHDCTGTYAYGVLQHKNNTYVKYDNITYSIYYVYLCLVNINMDGLSGCGWLNGKR